MWFTNYVYIYMSVCVKRCGKVLGRCLEIELVLHTDRIRSRKLLRGMQGGNGSFVVCLAFLEPCLALGGPQNGQVVGISSHAKEPT